MNIDSFDPTLPDHTNPEVQRRWAAASTPGRKTIAVLDTPVPIITERRWGGTRFAGQICEVAARSMGRDSLYTQNVRYWPSTGLWTLKPLQEQPQWQERLPNDVDISEFMYEPQPAGGGLTHLLTMEAIIGIKYFSLHTAPGGIGMSHDTLSSQFDYRMYRKTVAAGASWNQTLATGGIPSPPTALSGAPGVLGVSYPRPYVPLDVVVRSENEAPADCGFFLRWTVPGHSVGHPDTVMVFHFGQFALEIGGDGMASLYEYCRPTGAGSPPKRWVKRFTWRYCSPQRVCGTPQTMLIFPQYNQWGEKAIVFVGNQQEASQPGILSFGMPFMAPMETCWYVDPISRSGEPEESNTVTKAAKIRLDIRRDLRVTWQITRLMFLSHGGVIDAIVDRDAASSGGSARFEAMTRIPPSAAPVPTITATLKRTDTGAVVSSAAVGTVPLFANFLFTGGGRTIPAPPNHQTISSWTPFLYGYQLVKDAVTSLTAPLGNPPRIPTGVHSVKLSDPGDQPENAMGQLEVGSTTGRLDRLENRGVLGTKIVLNYRPRTGHPGAGAWHKITLFHGQLHRPKEVYRAPHEPQKGGIEGASGNPTRDCSLRVFQGILGGMGGIAGEIGNESITLQDYCFDAAAGPDLDGNSQPWKVTDAVRDLLRRRFPAAMVGIPDLALRLQVRDSAAAADLRYNPCTSILDMALRIVRQWLGGSLLFDLSQGAIGPDGSPDGIWRLQMPQGETATPLWEFYSASEIENVPGAGCSAWPYGTTFLSEVREYVAPPEYNHVKIVTAPGDAKDLKYRVTWDGYNSRSYAVPGSTIVPDYLSPHYVGYEKLLLVPAPELWAGADPIGIYERARLIGTRLMMYGGRGRRMVSGVGPLVLYWDTFLNRYRTLRYGDPVKWKGKLYFVRSCSPDISDDYNQIAYYELEHAVPLDVNDFEELEEGGGGPPGSGGGIE